MTNQDLENVSLVLYKLGVLSQLTKQLYGEFDNACVKFDFDPLIFNDWWNRDVAPVCDDIDILINELKWQLINEITKNE